LLKQSSGPVVGICELSCIWSFDLRTSDISNVRARFEDGLCADADFWSTRSQARFATLMQVAHVTALPAVAIEKRDRRGWVALGAIKMQQELSL
jgi:hypothetical protein